MKLTLFCFTCVVTFVAEDDILVRPELEALAKAHPSRFQLHYTVDRAPDGWKYSTGFISKEMIEEYLFSPKAGTMTQIFMCGPPPMIKVRFT